MIKMKDASLRIDDKLIKKLDMYIYKDKLINYIAGSLLLVNLIRNIINNYTQIQNISYVIASWLVNILSASVAFVQLYYRSNHYIKLREKVYDYVELVELSADTTGFEKDLIERNISKMEGTILEYIDKNRLTKVFNE